MRSELQWAIEFFLIAIVFALLAASRNSTPSVPGRLHYTRLVLILGLFGTGLFATLAVVSLFVLREPGDWRFKLLFLGFAVLSAHPVLEYFRVYHHLESEGLRYRRLFTCGGFMRWYEIERVSYSHTGRFFRIVTTDRKTIRISAMLVGLPQFAQLLLRHVPNFKLDGNTAQILERTAAGSPPSLFG